MAVEGSSAVYQGGSVAYSTQKCKPVLLNDADLHASLLNASAADAEAYKASKRDWTAKTAVAYCEAMGTDYAVAEAGLPSRRSGPRGWIRGSRPSPSPRGAPTGSRLSARRSARVRRAPRRRQHGAVRHRRGARVIGCGDGRRLDRCAGDRDDAEDSVLRGEVRRYLRRCDGGKAPSRPTASSSGWHARCGALRRRRNGHVPGHPRRRAALRRRRDPRDGRRPVPGHKGTWTIFILRGEPGGARGDGARDVEAAARASAPSAAAPARSGPRATRGPARSAARYRSRGATRR